ncbi:MAG: hypothetical protein F4X44_11825 [Gammaproteobacteria bacterium]|nr:hypothetical protein [Gammaproteobacteria bacterium]MYD81287.1 hypothetical protein [Gammaproteobacteria bacterium]
MPKFRVSVAIACFSCVFLLAAPDPRIYLQHDWYVVEMVVFERIDAPPSPEHLVHGAEYRVYSADLRSISPSELQQQKLEEIVQAHSNRDSRLAFDESTTDQSLSTKSTIPTHGCWLHQSTISAEIFNSQRTDVDEITIELTESSEKPDLFNDQSVINADLTQAIRNPLLPDWLPDDWETDEVIMHRVGNILGLCDEDVTAMIASQVLELEIRGEDSEETPLTAHMIEQEYAEYERELYGDAGTRRDPKNWTLARAASRMRSEGYRIIDHAAWHQDALERGTNKPFLVQLGEVQSDNSFEVEGTIVLSSARFLHLDIDLWKSVKPQESPTEIDNKPRLLYYSMQESRRLTLGKTHYFDHPKFGMLVRVQRLPVPERLVSLLEQLDSAF